MLIVGLLNVLLFFRYSIFSGFSRSSANGGDSLLVMAQLEHWRHAWLLEVAWRSPIYFYPVKGALGYGDAYFLYGCIYSLLRAAGVDWFAAYDVTNMAVLLAGFFSFVYLAHCVLKIRLVYVLLGATVFCQLNSLSEQLLHSQLLTVGLAPLALGLFYRFVEGLLDRSAGRILAFGGGAIALYTAWLMTTYYMAWFFALFAFTATVWFLCIAGIETRRRLLLAVSDCWRPLLALAVFAALCLIPFIVTYLPTAMETRMYSHAEMVANSGTPLDALNVGRGNLIYSAALDRLLVLLAGLPFEKGERATGFTPVLLLLFLIAAVYCWRRPIGIDQRIMHATLGAIAVLWMGSMRFGDNHLLLWNVVFYTFPGAQAMRVPPRFQIFVGFFVVLTVTFFLDRQRWLDHPAAFLLLAALLVVEQLNQSDGWGIRRADLNWAYAAAPPPQCRSFFVLREAGAERNPGLIDEAARNRAGMLVAEIFNLPTLNGVASFEPRNWDLLKAGRKDYIARALSYARVNGVMDGLCGLDIPKQQWLPVFPP